MKTKTHPKYETVLVHCTSCGNKFLSGSTKVGKDTEEFEGKEYPVLKVDICSNCHGFFTGQTKVIDSAGRIEKFKKKYNIK
jgi:large subunit ribosomal protein L31